MFNKRFLRHFQVHSHTQIFGVKIYKKNKILFTSELQQ